MRLLSRWLFRRPFARRAAPAVQRLPARLRTPVLGLFAFGPEDVLGTLILAALADMPGHNGRGGPVPDLNAVVGITPPRGG